MSTKKTGVNIQLPEYFFYSGQLYKVADEKISIVDDGKGCPPTSIGLVPTDELEHRVNYLQGRLLTIIDASISDKEQKKAIKDLIKQIMFEEHSRLSDNATGFHTLSNGDMIQFSGSTDKFYEENVEPHLEK